jgi:hypothetical protein
MTSSMVYRPVPLQVMQTFFPLQREQVSVVRPPSPELPPVPLHFGHLQEPLHVVSMTIRVTTVEADRSR